MRAPSPRWSARSCAGRGRAGQRRASRTRWRRSARTQGDAASARSAQQARPTRSRSAQALVAELGAALAPLEERRGARCRSPRIAARIADALRALSRDDAGVEAAFAGDDGAGLARRSTRHRRAAAPICSSRRRLSRAVRDRHRRPRRAAAPDAPGARVRIFGPLEARLQTSTAWCSAAWSKACGRRRRAAIRGSPADAARARPRSAGAPHRPVGARLRAGARRARGDADARRQARRRADRSVAFRAAARGGRRRDALEARAGARRVLSRAGRAPRPPESVDAGRAPAPKPPLAARPTRSASPRSRTGCAIPTRSMPSIFCGCARSMRSTRRPARAIAAP